MLAGGTANPKTETAKPIFPSDLNHHKIHRMCIHLVSGGGPFCLCACFPARLTFFVEERRPVFEDLVERRPVMVKLFVTVE